MAENKTNIEIFVMVDADGNAVSSHDEGELETLWTENIGDVPAVSSVYKLSLTVPTPKVFEVRATLPAISSPAVELAVSTVS